MRGSKFLLLLIISCLIFGACQEEDEYVILKGKRLKEIAYVDVESNTKYVFTLEYDGKNRACKVLCRDLYYIFEDSSVHVYEWHKNMIRETRPDYWIDTLLLRNQHVQTINEGYFHLGYYHRNFVYDYVYDKARLQKINKLFVHRYSVLDTIVTKFDDFYQTTSKAYCKGYNPVLIMDKIWKLDFLSLAHPNLFGVDTNVLVGYLKESEKSIEYILDDEGYVTGWNEWKVSAGHPYLNHGYVVWE